MSGKGRPKALQVETSAITAKNRTLDTLLTNEHFTEAMKSLDQGWVFDSQETGQFPHYSNDLRSLPTHLRRLLNHKPRSRGRASTLKDSNSPSSSSHGEREREKERESRLPCGSATNPEDRGLKTEMNRTEGYHIHTSCVQLAFVDSYTHQATLRTTSFVDDFPIHVWVFIPPSLLDKSLASQEPALPVPAALPMSGAHSEKIHDAMISFIAHAPQPVKARLERLQLLFIMRLKDSFTEFKNSLMRFLVLPSSNNKSATKSKGEMEMERGKGRGERHIDEKMFEMTNLSRDANSLPELLQLPDSLSQARNSTSLQHVRSASQGHIPDVKSSTHDGKSTVGDKPAARGSTPSSVMSSASNESDVSATISGCVIVESIEACIILPSILKAHGIRSSGTPVGNAVSPKSPSTPLAGAGGNKKLPSVAEAAKRAENAIRVPKSEVQESGNGVLESKNENWEPRRPSEVSMSLCEGGVENHFGEQAQVSMPHPSQGSQTGFTTSMSTQGSLQSGLSSQTGLSMSASGSATPSPRISPAPSQMSLTNQFIRSNMSNTHSPSITSLPTLELGGRDSLSELSQSFNYPRGNPTTGPAVPSSLNIRPPARSLSASHLPPLATRGSTTVQPHHPMISTLPPHSRNSVSTVIHGRSSTPTFQDRHSPVSAIIHESSRGYTTNYIAATSQMGERETQSERSSPVVHVTAIGGTGTVIETQYESKALWSESPHEETDFIMIERPEDTSGTCINNGTRWNEFIYAPSVSCSLRIESFSAN